eukprot:5329143-Prymnesium_polylepis.1
MTSSPSSRLRSNTSSAWPGPSSRAVHTAMLLSADAVSSAVPPGCTAIDQIAPPCAALRRGGGRGA